MEYRKRRIILQNLKRKGFVEEREGDHIFLKFRANGEYKGIRTKVSHGSKANELSEELISRMAKQCKLSKKNFVGLVDCSLSELEYMELLDD